MSKTSNFPVAALTAEITAETSTEATDEPRCTGVDITVSTGGKVQIVQFKLANDFTFGYTERYTIPSDWTDERLDEWKQRKTQAMKARADEYAQAEQDALLATSDWCGK